MAESAPSARSSWELERGEVREVAELGNALTDLFNTLKITQNAYAVRISMDKSIVSRYLRGRKVATQDFIDRLVREVETRRGASVQPEVRNRLTQLRLDALKVTSPATYELEALRAEMVQSERKVQMLVRHQEALHDLLEKRETDVRTVQGELEAVRQDWTADLLRAERAEIVLHERAEQHSTERERLVEEITRFRAELSEIASLKAEAERRCADLEARVRAMEEELATGLGTSGESQLPLALFKEQLARLVEAGEQREASREVAEAAWGRSIGEIAALVAWLSERRDYSRRDRLIAEVAHARDVEELAEFGHLVRNPGKGYLPSVLINETAAVRSPQEVIHLHTEWLDCWSPRGGSLLKALLRSPRDEGDVVETLSLLDPMDMVALTLLRELRGTPSYDRRYTRIITRLEEIGCEDAATALCENLFWRLSVPLKSLLSGLNDQQCASFTGVLLRSVPIEVITHWLVKDFTHSSGRADDEFQLDHRVAAFIDMVSATGRLPEMRASIAAVNPRSAAASSVLRYLEN
ncbi:hypothetical protein [Streptomyces fulvoviolaceus]|uniref:hypothetical protein n=1 Tax=Streptomyces fulvoviolaceus TaxID=285535 RepID=UPI0021C019AA|nr:hypothetical protein [Streptomyces fulvoviolaceus]MCT9084270.1 hypothetical protein [Streptomyces fulvoviolaceus]